MGCTVSQQPEHQQFSFHANNLSPKYDSPQDIQKQLDKIFIQLTPKKQTPEKIRQVRITPDVRYTQSSTSQTMPITMTTLNTQPNLQYQQNNFQQKNPQDQEVQRIFSKHEELKSKLKHYLNFINESKIEEQKIQQGRQFSNYSQQHTQTSDFSQEFSKLSSRRFDQNENRRLFSDAQQENPRIQLIKMKTPRKQQESKSSWKENSYNQMLISSKQVIDHWQAAPILKKDSLNEEYLLAKDQLDLSKVSNFIDHYEQLLTSQKKENLPQQNSLRTETQITQDSLLLKMEKIKQQFGIGITSQKMTSFSSQDQEEFYSRKLFKKRNREEQEQSFSLSPSPLIENRNENFNNIRVNSFTYEESLKQNPQILYQIQEEQVEETTEEDLKNKHTPSLQDIQPNISSREFLGYYDEKMKICVAQIDKSIKEKESTSSQEYNTQLNLDLQRKSFDQYYQEYVEDQLSGLEEEIGQLSKLFLKKVKTTKSKLKSSLKDLYKTVVQNCDNFQQSVQANYVKISSNSSTENDEAKYTSIKERILLVGQELEQISNLRRQMMDTIKVNCNHVKSIESLRHMKSQIQDSFGKVEQEIRVINDHYSESDTKTFSSNENEPRQRFFETELNSNQTQQTFEEYKIQINRNFQTENNQVFEYDEEESSTQG